METTTYTGTGINGQAARIELAQVGEIIVITTGSTKFRTYRQATARVTGHTFVAITGTEFGTWHTEAVTADGETITDHRVRPATELEAAEYTVATEVTEVVSEERAAEAAHTADCLTCSISAETGRNCPEGMKLWEARHRKEFRIADAPIVTVNRWGTRRAHWNMAFALAEVGLNGGEVLLAPEGMTEALARKQAAEKVIREARRAARKAAGITIRPPRRR